MNKPGKKRSAPRPAPNADDPSAGKERPKRPGSDGPSPSPPHDAGFQAILDIVRAKAGQDFRCYKPSTVARRIERRMALSKTATPAEYARFLEEDPDEAGLLQKDLLIGVTEFFRQPQAWEVLKVHVIAPLVERTPAGSEIRIWAPGCSTGQEPYSLAILLAEQIEASGKDIGFQIFATDNDAAALATARGGSYPAEDIGEAVSPARLKKFFVCREGCCQVAKEIRGKIVFAPQNLTADPPFSRLDLISCRNLLIYLDQDVQRKIIALFHFALREGGFLFLGSAETTGDRVDLFEPVSPKWRIYRRIGAGRPAGVEIPFRPAGEISPPRTGASVPGPVPQARQSLAAAAQQLILDRFAPACVVIDRKLQVLYVHGPVEEYLTFPAGELTTRVVDMAREGLRARLGAAIAECLEAHRPVSVEARVRRGARSVPVGATVSPLKFPREIDGLLLIAFEDCALSAAKARRPAEGKDEFQQLQDELKITREELQSTIAQLEGFNDQLKASNEEVTASNEELQSANEELETSKEELQSLNEELNTINARLQDKVEELEGVNNDLLNLLESTAIATVFLDRELKVKRYTPASTRLFSLIPSDLGRPIADILRRFDDETLFGDAARVLADLAPLSKEVRSEDGRWYIRRITPYRTMDDRIEGVVVTFVDVCDIKRTEEALREAREQAEWLARMPGENPNAVARVSADGFTLYANPVASETPGWRCRVGRPIPEPLRAMVIRAMAEAKPIEEDVELGGRPFSVTVVPVPDANYANIYGRDIAERKKAEEALRRSEEEYRHIFETANEGIWITDGERKTTLVNQRMLDMLGYAKEELLGREPAEFLAPDQEAVTQKARQAITAGSRTQQEFKFRRKDGSVLWALSSASPVVDRDGRLIRTVSMLTDITVRKRAEEEIERQAKEMRESNEELARFNRAAVGRELRMIELKAEVNELCGKAGEPPRYRLESEKDAS
jgi:PAS domain S-box-containing protein